LDTQDSLIVDELKRDSALGIRLLVETYQNRLYAWGRQQYEILNDQDLFEIIDDTFMRVIDNIDSFQLRTEKGFKNWLFTIFSRLCLDHLRKEKRITECMQVRSLDTDRFKSHNGALSSIQLELDRTIFQDYFSPKSQEHPLAEKVRDFLESLDEKDRTIILACAMGIPYREIGEWTGIPVGHVKVYYSRLKKKLERYLIEAEGA
jgi:RNA polymerase sigma factor (sigma-70 family)